MKRMLAGIAVLMSAMLIVVAPSDAAARGGHGGGFHGGGFHGGGFHGGGFHGGGFHGGRGFHHGFRPGFGHHFGGARVFIGVGPFWGPYWWPYYPPYYYPPAYTVPVVTEPQTYIQQSPVQAFWYYCESARGYYPYVQQCPGGWLTVVPRTGAESR